MRRELPGSAWLQQPQLRAGEGVIVWQLCSCGSKSRLPTLPSQTSTGTSFRGSVRGHEHLHIHRLSLCIQSRGKAACKILPLCKPAPWHSAAPHRCTWTILPQPQAAHQAAAGRQAVFCTAGSLTCASPLSAQQRRGRWPPECHAPGPGPRQPLCRCRRSRCWFCTQSAGLYALPVPSQSPFPQGRPACRPTEVGLSVLQALAAWFS